MNLMVDLTQTPQCGIKISRPKIKLQSGEELTPYAIDIQMKGASLTLLLPEDFAKGLVENLQKVVSPIVKPNLVSLAKN